MRLLNDYLSCEEVAQPSRKSQKSVRYYNLLRYLDDPESYNGNLGIRDTFTDPEKDFRALVADIAIGPSTILLLKVSIINMFREEDPVTRDFVIHSLELQKQHIMCKYPEHTNRFDFEDMIGSLKNNNNHEISY
ncbi:MAG: hypothetical protein HOM96_03015 [Rickettsiales bacterium]|nr:hypothetical protein [Rickettsiales bacterium]